MSTTQREIRYLTAEELTRLRRHAEADAVRARERGTVGAIRAWALLDTLLSSGLRASEVAALRVGDCLLGYGQASLVVQSGKGDKRREVLHPPGTESPPEGLPGLEDGPGGGCLNRRPGLHGSAGAAYPEWGVAGGQGPHGDRGLGSPVRHAHMSPLFRVPDYAGWSGHCPMYSLRARHSLVSPPSNPLHKEEPDAPSLC
jgi:hypothetical protein